MSKPRNKIVQFRFDASTYRYRAEFLDGEATVNWKWLTTVEIDGLRTGLDIIKPVSNRPTTHDADRLQEMVSDGTIFFDSDDETNFEYMLRELLNG